MKTWLTILLLGGCGSGGGAQPDAAPDVAIDAVLSPEPEPDPVVSACTSPLALPALPAIAQVSPKALAIGDFDEDGKQDFVVVQGAPAGFPGAVITYTGDGAAGFTRTSSATVTPSIAITQGHLDGDGHLDVLVVSASYAPTSVLTVLLGAGDGTFGAPTTYALPESAQDITLADLDGDSRLDAIVASRSAGVSILRGNGDGTLQARVDLAMPSVRHIAAARLDGDTDLDLALTLEGTSMVRILPANGDRTFGTPVDVDAGYRVDGIAAGDFDEDGDLDLVAAHDLDLPPTGTAHVLVNDGTGTFSAGAAAFSMPIGDVLALDLDSDANLDIVSIASAQLGGGDGSFTQGTVFSTSPGGVTTLAVGNFDGDSKSDLLLARDFDGLISVVRGGAATATVDEVYSQQAGTPAGIAIADFNGDTKPDFAVLNYYLNPGLEPGTIAVFLAADSGFAAPQLFATGYGATTLLVTDFDQDGRPDLAASHGPFGFGPGVTVLMNTGPTFTRTDYAAPSSAAAIVAGDFDRDGRLDLLRSEGTALVLMHGGGDGTFADAASTSLEGDASAAGDFDGDGDLDLVTTSTSQVAVALNSGSGTFVMGPSLKVAAGRARAAVADLDRDGDQDIMVRTPTRLLIYRNAGAATFDELAPIELEASGSLSDIPASLQLADLDGDGHKDAITTMSQAATLVVVRGNGDMTFAAPLVYPAAGQAARVGHLDADQHLDVVSAGVGGGIRILRNTCAP